MTHAEDVMLKALTAIVAGHKHPQRIAMDAMAVADSLLAQPTQIQSFQTMDDREFKIGSWNGDANGSVIKSMAVSDGGVIAFYSDDEWEWIPMSNIATIRWKRTPLPKYDEEVQT